MGLEDDIQRKAESLKRMRAQSVPDTTTWLQYYDADLQQRWNELEENLARIAGLLSKRGMPTEKIIEKYTKQGFFSDSVRTRHAADGWQVHMYFYLDTTGHLWLYDHRPASKGKSESRSWVKLHPSSMEGSGQKRPYKVKHYDVLPAADGSVELVHDYGDGDTRIHFLRQVTKGATNILAKGGGPGAYRSVY